jgi:hypothetical protein
MKTIMYRFFVLIIVFFGIANAYSAPDPPSPKRIPPPPPGLPIDENVFVLVITAILLGAYVFYKYHLKAKASI